MYVSRNTLFSGLAIDHCSKNVMPSLQYLQENLDLASQTQFLHGLSYVLDASVPHDCPIPNWEMAFSESQAAQDALRGHAILSIRVCYTYHGSEFGTYLQIIKYSIICACHEY